MQDHYIYMEDLRALQECKHDPMPTGTPKAIVSPLSENAGNKMGSGSERPSRQRIHGIHCGGVEAWVLDRL